MAKQQEAQVPPDPAVQAAVDEAPKGSVLLRVVTPFLDHFQVGDDETVIHRTPTAVSSKTAANKIISAAENVGVVVEIVEV